MKMKKEDFWYFITMALLVGIVLGMIIGMLLANFK